MGKYMVVESGKGHQNKRPFTNKVKAIKYASSLYDPSPIFKGINVYVLDLINRRNGFPKTIWKNGRYTG